MSSSQLLIDFYVNSNLQGIRRLRERAMAIRDEFDLGHFHFAIVSRRDQADSLCGREFHAFKVLEDSKFVDYSPERMGSNTTTVTKDRLLHLSSRWFSGDALKIPEIPPLCNNCRDKVSEITDREKSIMQQQQQQH